MFRLAFSLSVLSTLLLPTVACRQHPAHAKVTSQEQYISDPHSLGFDIKSIPTDDGSRSWLATYSDQGKTAKFTIALMPSKSMGSEAGGMVDFSSGKGVFLAEPGSNASTMLIALKKALEAKHLPSHVEKCQRLSFTYVILGEHNSQASDGGMTVDGKGNWTAMKIFIGDGDESEVFLNFNPVLGKAQFAEKDVDYGDATVAKLATVL